MPAVLWGGLFVENTMTDETEKLAEAPADETVNLDAPVEVETETKAADEPKDEGAEDAGDDAGDKPKKPSGAQRAKLREARLLNELSEAQRRIDELSRQSQAPAAGDNEEKEPVEADFNGDFFAYQQAATAFKAGKAARDAIEKVFKTREQSEQSVRQTAIARDRDLAHAERVESAREIIADYDETMKAMAGVTVRNEVIDEIKSSEKGAEIAYHLAKNPNLLAAMDRMSPRELAREMGRLEATVKLPTAKKQTMAPPPLEPLKGGASGSFDPEKASMDDYVAKRKSGWKG